MCALPRASAQTTNVPARPPLDAGTPDAAPPSAAEAPSAPDQAGAPSNVGSAPAADAADAALEEAPASDTAAVPPVTSANEAGSDVAVSQPAAADTSGAATNAADLALSAQTTTAAPVADARDVSLSSSGYPLTPQVTAAGYPDELVVSGYLQAQYEAHQDSEDQQLQGGGLLNKDRFVLRRGRIKVARDWDWGQVQLELDGNTVRGPTLRVQRAEVSVLYGRQADKDQPPLAQLTFGQFDVPFGFETTYTAKARWFMERTTAARAFFPAEPDVGARLSGGFAFARYSIAVTNGEPLDERSGLGLQDPNANKDITARFGAEAKITPAAVLAGGISFNRGRGFHAATDATKNGLTWRDLNENGNVDQNEVFGLPGTQAVPAKGFSRWAVGADLEFLLHTKLGWSMLSAEAVAASNLDRGLVLADPIASGSNIREFGYYIALTQEITRYALVGFRYDYYDPNSDFFDKRAGKLIPTSQRVRTLAPLLALVLPNHVRLVFEWDFVSDYLARDSRGVPRDLRNNQWTLRLQGMF